MQKFGDAGGALAAAQGEVGDEGTGQGVLASAGRRVTDIGAGDPRGHPARGLFIHEQLHEDIAQGLGSRVLPAPQRHLGLGLSHGPRRGIVPLVVVGVQQVGRCPAVDAGGELPGQVDRVAHAEVDADAGGRKLVGRVAGHQDPPGAVPIGLAGLEGVPGQPRHLAQREIRAEEAYRGSFLSLRRDEVALPDGKRVFREYIVHPGAVAVVALTDDGRIVMERQHRYPLRRDFIEVPAGKREAGEAALDTARRELEEETGGTASRTVVSTVDEGSRAPPPKRLPPFFIGSYADALRSAKEQIKILAIILVSREHGDVERFKQNTLTDSDLVELLSHDDFIIWGGDVREREAYQVATTLQASTYPFVAFIALQPPRPSSRTSVASSTSSPRAAVLSRLEGSPSSATSAGVIASHISDVLLPRTRTYLDRLRAEKRRREMERQLRADQDRAYQEASRRDAERIAQKREEERQKALAAQRAREEQEQKELFRRKQEAWQKWALHNLVPPEPTASKEAVRLSFRLPSGKTLVRRFSPNDTVETVFAFVESASSLAEAESTAGAAQRPSDYQHVYQFSLVTGYPRKRIEFAQTSSMPLKDVDGLAQGASLIIEGQVLGDRLAATDDEEEEDDDENDDDEAGKSSPK